MISDTYTNLPIGDGVWSLGNPLASLYFILDLQCLEEGVFILMSSDERGYNALEEGEEEKIEEAFWSLDLFEFVQKIANSLRAYSKHTS